VIDAVIRRPGLKDLRDAAQRLRGVIHETPVRTSAVLDRMIGASLFFKCENLQITGAFKARGAANAVLSTDEVLIASGVATHSSGNHGAALAWAATLRGVPAWVVVPRDASPFKRDAIARQGARLIECGPTLAEREAALADVVATTGAHVIPPYDDARIIAGQGTAALELISQVPSLDSIVAPVGGGGMVSGTLLAATPLGIEVIGAEPELAGDAAESLRTGIRQPQMSPVSIADGLRTSLGALNFAICRDHRLNVILVAEDEIRLAQTELMRELDMPVETSAAVTFAAVKRAGLKGRIGLMITGGNVPHQSP
jgi:threonine dehydratase/serine racemase